jgi:CBS domain-containing protein
MAAELLEIRQHMGRFPPFDALDDDLLDEVAGQLEVSYFKAGTEIHQLNQELHELCYIRSGAVEVRRRTGDLYNRLGEGDIFGHFSLLRNNRVRFPARALEDTLIYHIPEAVFVRLCEADEHFADFVELERPRLEAAVEESKKANDMMITRVRKLLTRYPVMVEAGATVQEAARQISVAQASAALILDEPDGDPSYTFTDSEDRPWRLRGILTDTDFRTRIVAEGLPPDTAVGELAGERLITIQSDESVHEAMLCMLRNNIHHLPVLYRRRPVGILHLSDIIRYETHSSLYLVSNIFNQSSVEGLARLAPDVRAAFVRMVEEGANSQMVGTALSTIGRSFVRRLLELGEEMLGPPPVAYCFMVNGSMARNEQTIVTDQDHAMILADDFDPARHDDYFANLAAFVSDGLAACGYTYCKGDVMATNPKWRQPLSRWKRYFSEWIDSPTPKRLLHSSIFFDLDSAYGEEAYVEELQDLIAQTAPQSPRFLAAMARNALNRTPPLGFFRTFVMEKDGKHNNSINLKRRGTAPLVDLIRVHALACGSSAQNSFERLDDIAATQLLAPGVGDKLRYAMELLSMVRIRHQVFDLQQEHEPDNNIEPENVADSERHHLKDAFQVLSHAQKFLKYRYPLPAQAGRGH